MGTQEKPQNGWQAEWIWTPSLNGQHGPNEFAYFRKSFRLRKKIRQATLYGSAHNHYKVFVNGTPVSGEVSPAPSNPVRGKLYNRYDITNTLAPGNNAVGAAVCFWGGSGQNYVNGVPGLFLQLEICYADGSTETQCTNETWRCLRDTPYQIHGEFNHRRRIGAMEVYDARREPKGWACPEFSDAAWESAVPSEEQCAAWTLVPQSIPEGVTEHILTPQLCGREKHIRVYDAGKIISGWPLLTLWNAISGQPFTLRYSEDLNTVGRVKHNVCNDTSEFYCDRYISDGSLKEEWAPNFCYKAFRYCEIESDRPLPEYELCFAEAHTGYRQTGYFTCSDTMLNALFAACIQTQKNNMLGQLVDCPHREQAQYLADADLQAESLLYHFNAHPIVEKVLTDFSNGQHANGSFPFVYPSNYEHPDFSLKIPEWDLHFTILLWKVYYWTGEMRLLEQYFSAAACSLRRQLACIDETGLVKKTGDWHISDWPYPEIEQAGEYYTVHNCLVAHSALLAARMASLLGQEEYAIRLEEQAKNLREAICRELYDPEQKAFRDSSGSGKFSQAVSAAAVSLKVAPAADLPEILEHIVQGGHHTSTLLSLDLLRILFENGRGADAFHILTKEDDHSWARMIRLGHQTMWEGFQNIESHCHAWNAYIARVMTEYVAGIRLLSPGGQRVGIAPFLPAALGFAEASVKMGGGLIFVRWERIPRGYTLKLLVPALHTAEVTLPIWHKGMEVTERGSKIISSRAFASLPSSLEGLAIGSTEYRLRAAPGFYLFTIESPAERTECI